MAGSVDDGVATPIWLDVDTGHDDAFAILLAAHDPRFVLLGISTVSGNASVEDTTINTLGVLEALGMSDIPVYSGSSKPLKRDQVHAESIHGKSGLDGVTLLPKPRRHAAEDANYLDAMYEALIATAPRSAWLVATGALTNVAKLFSLHPNLAEHLQGLSIMGGAIGGGFTNARMGSADGEGERFGNWTPYAEFNIFCDPEAARIVLTHPVLSLKTVLIPLDLSHQVLATRPVRIQLLFSDITEGEPVHPPTPVRALFHQVVSFFAQTYADIFAFTEGPPLHDPLAVAIILDPKMFDDFAGERYSLEVVADEPPHEHRVAQGELGRILATAKPQGQPGVMIPRGVDVGKFWHMVDMALRSAETDSPLPPLSDAFMSKVMDLTNV